MISHTETESQRALRRKNINGEPESEYILIKIYVIKTNNRVFPLSSFIVVVWVLPWHFLRMVDIMSSKTAHPSLNGYRGVSRDVTQVIS